MKKMTVSLIALGVLLTGCVAPPYYDGGEGMHGNAPGHPHDRDGYRNCERGNCERDKDGIPNRRDRDRDRDGVPNRQDQRPDNPYRQ